MSKNINSKKDYIKIKSERREKKKTDRRHAFAVILFNIGFLLELNMITKTGDIL